MRHIRRLAIVLSAMVVVPPANSFAALHGRVAGGNCHRRNTLHSSNEDTNKSDKNMPISTNEWQGFNPFDPATQKTTVSSSVNRISLRKNRMQELMSNLLSVAGDDTSLQVLLESSKDLLLEPLEDDDAVLETDSIYTSSMTRKERYQVYRTTMMDRIAKAKNTNVRVVLQAMSNFVLSHE
jgi:hypothetical protein